MSNYHFTVAEGNGTAFSSLFENKSGHTYSTLYDMYGALDSLDKSADLKIESHVDIPVKVTNKETGETFQFPIHNVVVSFDQVVKRSRRNAMRFGFKYRKGEKDNNFSGRMRVGVLGTSIGNILKVYYFMNQAKITDSEDKILKDFFKKILKKDTSIVKPSDVFSTWDTTTSRAVDNSTICNLSIEQFASKIVILNFRSLWWYMRMHDNKTTNDILTSYVSNICSPASAERYVNSYIYGTDLEKKDDDTIYYDEPVTLQHALEDYIAKTGDEKSRYVLSILNRETAKLSPDFVDKYNDEMYPFEHVQIPYYYTRTSEDKYPITGYGSYFTDFWNLKCTRDIETDVKDYLRDKRDQKFKHEMKNTTKPALAKQKHDQRCYGWNFGSDVKGRHSKEVRNKVRAASDDITLV